MSELWKIFATVATGNPDKVLITECSGTRCTAAALLDAAQKMRLPGHLNRQKVLLHLPNGVQWLTAFLALHKAGAVVMPVDPGYGATELQGLQRETQTGFLFDETGLHGAPSTGEAPEGAVLVKLTSGSTGNKKPLFFTADALMADGSNVARSMDIRSDDINLAVIPFGHSYGMGNLIMPMLLQGTPVVVPDGFLPACLARACAEFGATVMPGVPVHFKTITQAAVQVDDFQTIRRFISAGGVLEKAVREEFRQRFNAPLHNFYGSSETGGIAYDRAGTLDEGVGTALDGVEITTGNGGALLLRSGATALGLPMEGGWFVLPDRGKIGLDGVLLLEGRSLDFVKVGGRKIFLSEVEKALRELPEVHDVHVEVLESEGHERLAAVLETALSPQEIRAGFLERNPAWKLPRSIRTLPVFPRNARGKLDRAGITPGE